jgi:hypothetical protein
MIRTASNRVLSYTGTVHWATIEGGRAACGARTHQGWRVETVATVTCKRCIAGFGVDEPGHVHVDREWRDESIVQRELERAVRQAARRAAQV